MNPNAGLAQVACLVLGIGSTLAAGAEPQPASSQPVPVTIERGARGYRLLRGGEPFVIRGAGGSARLEELVAAGGNSIRTWHARNVGETLDRAHERGLAVTVGIWLGHERHGFDYSDAGQVAADRARAHAVVVAHKDHPAVLMWGIGNEMEGNGQNPKVWQAVNDIARMIKELDPHHPTMTVIAGTGEGKVREFVKHCPDVDVLGINAYGDLAYIPREAAAQGLDRPYVITEFGPTGWWQVAKTSWGAELEPTSTEKAKTYLAGYEAAVLSQPDRCLGAYAFLWGHKQEHTHTWFGMFLPTGERTPAVDVMTRVWTGAWPANRCPEVQSLTIDAHAGVEQIHAPGTRLTARVGAADPDGDALAFTWELLSESTDKKSGGDPEQKPPVHPQAIVQVAGPSASVALPATPGAYRLFVYVTDGQNHAATANIPLLVR